MHLRNTSRDSSHLYGFTDQMSNRRKAMAWLLRLWDLSGDPFWENDYADELRRIQSRLNAGAPAYVVASRHLTLQGDHRGAFLHAGVLAQTFSGEGSGTDARPFLGADYVWIQRTALRGSSLVSTPCAAC
jgi:hypothetical protein